jgi:hypothetical protein
VTPAGVEVVFDPPAGIASARLAFIGDGGEAVAATVARPLGLVDADGLLEAIDGEGDGATRGTAVMNLAALWSRAWADRAPSGGDRYVAHMRRFFGDADPLVRECAVKAAVMLLGWDALRHDVARLAEADPDETVRHVAEMGAALLDRAQCAGVSRPPA